MVAAPLEEVLFRIKVHGWCVLPAVIPLGEVATIRADMERVASEEGGGGRIECILNKLEHTAHNFSRYLASERIMAPVSSIFGGQHIRVRTNAGFVNPPITEPQPEHRQKPSAQGMHADGPFLQQLPVRVAAPYQDATIQLTAIWMLSDFTVDNGATRLLTGSHRANTNPTANAAFQPTAAAIAAAEGLGDLSQPDPAIVTATGTAGDVILFDNRCWHGGGPNISSGPRVGLIMVYFPWWLCQDQNRPPGTAERARLKAETGLTDAQLGPGTLLLPATAFAAMADEAKPLVRHWLEPPARL